MSFIDKHIIKFEKEIEELDEVIRQHNKMIAALPPYIGYEYNDVVCCEPTHRDIIYIHKTSCPSCGGLLDGDELKPYTYCQCCGAKVWSEREVS